MSRDAAMLSRAAEGLFWMARYIERADNVARLLDAGRRINLLPSSKETQAAEWASIVIASGCSETFPKPLEEADMASVAWHLVLDPENPSSIRCSFEQARSNARAWRVEITSEVWDAVNEAWRSLGSRTAGVTGSGRLAPFIDWTKLQGQRFRGAVEDSLLRDPGYCFVKLGEHIERADSMARLLDVKYHVLLPGHAEVGGAVDQGQWAQILRAANSLRAFRHVYHQPIAPWLVADLLILNRQSPRSLMFCVESVGRQLDELANTLGNAHACHVRAADMRARLAGLTVDDIFAEGLHEFLTAFIRENNFLAREIAEGYGFGPVITPEETAVAEQ
jgi:uncharacterized alpha-E superfamily protein